MIQITLTFRTTDDACKALREIPDSLIVSAPAQAAAAPAAEAKPEPKPAKVEEKKPEAAKPEAAATQATAETSAAPEPKVENSAPAVDYPTLQKAVFKLAGESREAAAAVAASFGVKTFKELPQGQWAEALAAVQAKTTELGAA